MAFGILTEWTPRRMLGVMAAPGRAAGQTSGSYVDDLAQLGKAISLCADDCAKRFNAKRYRYGTHPTIPFARGRCDGCGQHSDRNRLFVTQKLATAR